jgi:hypothetical protein
MPQDFSIAVTSGATLQPWNDPPRPVGTLGGDDLGAPSRLNPVIGHGHTRWVGTVGTEIELTATVIGMLPGPLDAALGGRLFSAWRAETPEPVFAFSSPAGKSSVQRFTPLTEGHYTIGMRRTGGGEVLIHLDVEAA